MAKRKEFYLYRRKKKNGYYWYVCYINPDTAIQESAKSIDVLKERLGLGSGYTVKDRDTAAIIAYKALEAGLIFSASASVSFNSYCLAFWDYDSSDYVMMRNRMRKNSIGREYCMNMLCNYRKHVEPCIPSRVKLSNVTVEMLDRVVSEALSSGLATGSVQLIILSFSIPLKEAFRKRIIKFNPALFLMKVPRSEKERGILTHQEVKALVRKIDSLGSDRIALAVKLSLVTGLRSGEVRALTRDSIETGCIERPDGCMLARLTVDKSIAPYSGIKCTKNRKSRELFIDNSFAMELSRCADSAGHVFPGIRSEYMTSVELRNGFYAILESVGIDEEERKRRNITFHSLRHMFNTILHECDVDSGKRMLALGHSSQSVNNRYLHSSNHSLVQVSFVSSYILSLPDESAVKSAEDFQYFLPSEKTRFDDSLSRYREQS